MTAFEGKSSNVIYSIMIFNVEDVLRIRGSAGTCKWIG